jgi:hypothetical protein
MGGESARQGFHIHYHETEGCHLLFDLIAALVDDILATL